MKKNNFWCILPLLMFTSCAVRNHIVPSKDFVSVDISADTVRKLRAGSAIKVNYKQSDKTEVTINCPENIADYLNVYVKNGELSAGFDHGVTIDGNCNVTISVSSPELSSIDVSSLASVSAGVINVSGTLDIEASSSGSVNIDALRCDDISVDASSLARVDISSAHCRSLDIESSASADVTVDNIFAEKVEAEASSAAMIKLSGNANTVKYETSSAAIIKASDLKADKLKKAEASSASNIYCSASEYDSVTENSGGRVSRK